MENPLLPSSKRVLTLSSPRSTTVPLYQRQAPPVAHAIVIKIDSTERVKRQSRIHYGRPRDQIEERLERLLKVKP